MGQELEVQPDSSGVVEVAIPVVTNLDPKDLHPVFSIQEDGLNPAELHVFLA